MKHRQTNKSNTHRSSSTFSSVFTRLVGVSLPDIYAVVHTMTIQWHRRVVSPPQILFGFHIFSPPNAYLPQLATVWQISILLSTLKSLSAEVDFKLKSLSVVAKFESEVNLCSLVKVRLSSVGWRVPWMLSSERSKSLDVPGCWAEKMLSLDVLVRSLFGCHLTPFLQKYTQAINSWRIWSFWHILYSVHFYLRVLHFGFTCKGKLEPFYC